jgi:hypothetical protein
MVLIENTVNPTLSLWKFQRERIANSFFTSDGARVSK